MGEDVTAKLRAYASFLDEQIREEKTSGDQLSRGSVGDWLSNRVQQREYDASRKAYERAQLALYRHFPELKQPETPPKPK